MDKKIKLAKQAKRRKIQALYLKDGMLLTKKELQSYNVSKA